MFLTDFRADRVLFMYVAKNSQALRYIWVDRIKEKQIFREDRYIKHILEMRSMRSRWTWSVKCYWLKHVFSLEKTELLEKTKIKAQIETATALS